MCAAAPATQFSCVLGSVLCGICQMFIRNLAYPCHAKKKNAWQWRMDNELVKSSEP